MEKHGVKLGFMSAFVKAAASALMEVPAVNAVIDGSEIIYRWGNAYFSEVTKAFLEKEADRRGKQHDGDSHELRSCCQLH